MGGPAAKVKSRAGEGEVDGVVGRGGVGVAAEHVRVMGCRVVARRERVVGGKAASWVEVGLRGLVGFLRRRE